MFLPVEFAIDDVPGFEPKTETRAPGLLLPCVTPEMGKQLTGLPITLPEPFTKTFTEPAEGPTSANSEGTVTFKLSLSSKPAAKAAAPAR